MASTEHTTTSRRLQAAARAERARLRRELDREQRRVDRLREQLSERESALLTLRERIEALAQFSDDDVDLLPPNTSATPPPSGTDASSTALAKIVPLHGYLRGAAIRIAAVQVLINGGQASPSTIHYSHWFQLFTDAGHGIAGQDPQASFLTQIGRSPVVLRGPERGLYTLDTSAPKRLRERLHNLHQELARLHDGQQTIAEIATVASRRAELTREVVETERNLREALISLAGVAHNASEAI
jgi:hypothetical protein